MADEVVLVTAFADSGAADHAAEELMRAGFPRDVLTVLTRGDGAEARLMARVPRASAQELARTLEELGGQLIEGADRTVVPATDVRFEPFTEAVLELPEFTEEVTVAKRAWVVEEVVLTKSIVERTDTVRETLRRHDVASEDAGS